MQNLSYQLLVDFSELGDKIFPKPVVEIGGFVINDSVISGFIVVVVLLLAALILRLTILRKKNTTPTAGQMFLEWLVCTFDKQAEGAENYASLMGPYTLGAAAYICCGVLIELFGFRPAMADISAGLALALCTFVFIHTLGFTKKKFKRLLHYLNPINIVTDLAVPVSMTFRLFGSILSGMIIMDLVYILVEGIAFAVVPTIIPALLTPIFTLFHALIQAYVFSMLTVTFVAEAIELPPPKSKKKRKKQKPAETAAQ